MIDVVQCSISHSHSHQWLLCTIDTLLYVLFTMGNTPTTSATSNTVPVTIKPAPKAPIGPASVKGMRVLLPNEIKGTGLLEDYHTVPAGTQRLGKGHYGSVTMCFDKQRGNRKCAVKSVAKLKPRHITMLKNEVAIMRQLDHPSIIKLYDVFETDTHVQLVMELCTGGELFDQIIAEQHFSEAKAARVIRTLLSAVDYCHRHNIVHRDLKPENFLLVSKAEDADLKVIDFGLSKRFGSGEEMHARVGTPYYIAPEVLEKKYGPECDLWSCGVVLYILLCGYPPFWGDRDQDIFRKVRSGRVSFEGPEWESVSERAKHLILRLLDKDRQKRITAGEALQHSWIKAAGGGPEQIINSTMFERMQHFTLYSRLKQLALVYTAQRLPEPDLRDTMTVFEKLDLNNVGVVGGREFHSALRACGYTTTEDESQRIMDALDVLGRGQIGLAELAAGSVPDRCYLASNALYEVFDAMAEFGRLTVDSLERFIAIEYSVHDPEVSREMAQEMVMQVDEYDDIDDEAGYLVFDAFLRMMCAGEGTI